MDDVNNDAKTNIQSLPVRFSSPVALARSAAKAAPRGEKLISNQA
jgi:4-hydroxybenzoate polyprenyltransferase